MAFKRFAAIDALFPPRAPRRRGLAGFRLRHVVGFHRRPGHLGLPAGPAERRVLRLRTLGGAGRGAVAESSKYFLTGKHLTPREAAADIFLSGLIAAASSSLLVLQMPAAWPEISR